MTMKSASRLVLAALLLPLSAMARETAPLTIDQLPEKAAAAIKAATAGAKEIKLKKEKEDGVDAIEAKWMVDGHQHEVTVTPEGKLLSVEEMIALKSAPDGVQAAVKKAAGDKEVTEVEKAIADGVTTYEAVIETKDGEVELKLDAAGKEIAREKEDDDEDEKDDAK